MAGWLARSALIATRGTFEVLVSWLSVVEQRVLHGRGGADREPRFVTPAGP